MNDGVLEVEGRLGVRVVLLGAFNEDGVFELIFDKGVKSLLDCMSDKVVRTVFLNWVLL